MILSPKLSQALKTAGLSLGIILMGATILMHPIPGTHPEIYTGIVADLCFLSPDSLKALSVKNGFCSDFSS